MKITSPKEVNLRYSEAFKLKVVEEIEKGRLTISEAMNLYDIKGGSTIYNWIRKYGKNHLIKRTVRIEMKDEKNINAELRREIKARDSLIAKLMLELVTFQSAYEVFSEATDEHKKKSLLSKLSPEQKLMLELNRSKRP